MKSPQFKKQKDILRWLLPRLKLCNSLFGNTPSKIPNHIETRQSTCFANQLTGFHTIQASTKDICKETLIGHSKVSKKKKRKSLVKPESNSELHKNSRQRPFVKNNKPLKPVCRKLHRRCPTGDILYPALGTAHLMDIHLCFYSCTCAAIQ